MDETKKDPPLNGTTMEGPRKTTLYMKKMTNKFRKEMDGDIEIVTARQCRKGADKKWNFSLKGPRFLKLDKDNAEAVRANLKMVTKLLVK